MAKRDKIIYWVATAWLALGMLSTGLVQLLKVKTGTGGADSLAHLGYPMYVLTLLGAWKILGVVAVLVPKFPLVKEWAYAGFFFLTTGALVSHFASGDGAKDFFGAALLLILITVSWYYRPSDRKIVSVNH